MPRKVLVYSNLELINTTWCSFSESKHISCFGIKTVVKSVITKIKMDYYRIFHFLSLSVIKYKKLNNRKST